MKSPDKIKKSLRIHTLPHPSGCIGCAYRGDNPAKIPNGCTDKLFKDVREYIKQLEAQVPHWISVEDRLPEKCECVLCIVRYGEDAWNHELGFVLNNKWVHPVGIDGTVTHWMPLPQPPKEEE